MPRVTKSVIAKAKHKKFYLQQRVITGLEVDYIKLLNSPTLNLCNMHLEIEKTKKEMLGLYGSQE